MPGVRAGRIDDDMAAKKRRRHTPDQMIRKLAEGNKLLGTGQELAEVCRHLEITESTWHRWVAQYGDMMKLPGFGAHRFTWLRSVDRCGVHGNRLRIRRAVSTRGGA